MEFDEIVVKDSPGLCRCCLSEGCYKDLGSEYVWMSETEVYADMLLDCFDISISQHNEGPNGPNRLICEVCITRLRDACNFKKQVLDSEKKFVDMVGKGEFSKTVVTYQDPMKTELPVQRDITDVEYLDEDLDFEDDNFNEPTETEATVEEDITVSMLPIKTKRGRPKKSVVKPEKVKMPKLEEKPRTSKVAKENAKTSKDNKYSRAGLIEMRNNITQIVLNSTVMPFRWLKSCFRCFYCYEMFEDSNDLKSHQRHHCEDDVKNVLNSYYETQVYVDISLISCKICAEVLCDLNSLLQHLKEKHNIKCESQENILPFNLDHRPQCLFCGTQFKAFRSLIIHISREHKEKCNGCGINEKCCEHQIVERLKCRLCYLNLRLDELKIHMKEAHRRSYMCGSCAEFFTSHYKRNRHVIEVHKQRKVIRCPHCTRTFIFRSLMLRHVRESHFKEKNCICEICAWRCFTNHELVNHKLKHTDKRDFKCPHCDKDFKSKKNMRKHCATIHAHL